MDIIKIITEKIRDNKIEEALKIILDNNSIYENNSEFWNLKGIICIKNGECQTAVNCLKMAVELENANIDAIYNLAYSYECLGEYNHALRTYSGLLQYPVDDELEKEIRLKIEVLGSKIVARDSNILVVNTDNKETPEPGDDVFSSRENYSEAVEREEPLVSVYVLAYNNLEKYTKTCISCILKYTIDIDYELILIDNGSTDGTFEYFKSIPYQKKKIIKITKNIGMYEGTKCALSHSKGKYIVSIANDVYVTPNWLSNMLKCAMSDNRIGMVNPVSDYVSNYQSVDLHFKDFDDMQKKALKFNVSDPRKWDERIRLITLGTLYRRECLDIIGLPDYGFFHDFADDDITFRVRRAGYKAILCKDVFVCHAGRINDKGSDIAYQSLQKGKKIFNDKYYGIDAWEDVNNYEPVMMSLIEPNLDNNINVLGIDVLCGTPLLETKNTLRAKGVFDVGLSAFATEGKYWLDLCTVCDKEVACDRIEYIKEHFQLHQFDYIILGKPLNEYASPYGLLDNMLDLLVSTGSLLVKIRNNNIYTLFNILGQCQNDPTDDCCSYLDLDKFNLYLKSKGYFMSKISGELYSIDEKIKKIILEMISKVSSDNVEQIYKKLSIKEYIVKIRKIN